MSKSIRFLLVLALTMMSSELLATRYLSFETEAFEQAKKSFAKSDFVFSPLSFELDCVLFADCLETIPKANVADSMGAAVGFESVYGPIYESLATRKNGFSYTTARGFCVPEIQKANPVHRQYLEDFHGVEVLRLYPAFGAESWFRASMEGEMEDFEIPSKVPATDRYSFYDLVSVRLNWKERFPTANTRKMKFYPKQDSEPIQLSCMSDVRVADTWETKKFIALRLPLENDAWFYAVVSKEAISIEKLVSGFNSVSEIGMSHGPCAIVLPKLEMTSRVDLRPVFAQSKVPVAGLTLVAPGSTPRECEQYVKFVMSENGVDQEPLEEKPANEIVALTKQTKRLVFNRPFVFFVYDERTSSLPIVGTFSGR